MTALNAASPDTGLDSLQKYLMQTIRAAFNTAAPVGRVSLIGETVTVLGESLTVVMQAQSNLGWPCHVIRALARCMSHCE